MIRTCAAIFVTGTLLGSGLSAAADRKDLGVGAKPVRGAQVIIDGSRATLDKLWTYWEGPRFSSWTRRRTGWAPSSTRARRRTRPTTVSGNGTLTTSTSVPPA